MARNEQDWRLRTAHFYESLYACAWQYLESLLGAAATLELVTLSRGALRERYPFLSHFAWSARGLEPGSLAEAIAGERPEQVQAGCERFLQGVHTVVREIGGDTLAQRLAAATEQQRGALERGNGSQPAAQESDAVALPPESPLSLLQDVARQALRLYGRLQGQPTLFTIQAATHGATPSATDALVDIPEASKDLARSEAFYHGLFDLSPDGVVVTNSTGIILKANPRAAELLEFDGPEVMVGLDAVEFYVHPEQRLVLLEQVTQRHHIEGRGSELRTRRGRTIIVQASTRLIEYEGQVCLLSVFRDVTERARLRQEMEDFAYSASHDLQAPLRTFEGYARWLVDDYGEVLGDEGRHLCEEIIDDALHMKKLLDGLLEYSRIGRIHTQAVDVDVRRVLDWVLHDLQLEVNDTGADVQLPESLPTVMYSEVRLVQIFSNLISNALKFTNGEGPRVSVACEDQERYYRFAVSDNGIGIAEEHFGRIFESFRRLHTREAYPGTGAGLTIVKKIVESNGGQIGVESAPGVGSTFWFTIPKTEGSPCAA
jgi:PAS domain S-box-containing protein